MNGMYFFKVAWVGDERSQKSVLLRQLPSITFQYGYLHTIGSDFVIKTVFAEHDGERIPIKLSLWDMNPHPLFREIRATYYRGCSGGIVIFNVHRANALESIQSWMDELITFSGMNDMPIFLLGMDHEHVIPPITEHFDLECTNDINWPDVMEQLRQNYPRASIYPQFFSQQDLEHLDCTIEILAKKILERLTNSVSDEIFLNNPSPRYQNQGHHSTVIMLNNNATFPNADSSHYLRLGISVTRAGVAALSDPIPILQVRPLYQCALHRERLLPSHSSLASRSRWYQCQTCEVFLCEECRDLIHENFNDECPNPNWPSPHPFIAKNR